MQRIIIHIDMDAFYAAVEQRDKPCLKGKPVIIGGLNTRGVVSTASYEARKFGIRSAMPIMEARRRCPEGIFLAGNHDKYLKVAYDIRQIFIDFSPFIETLGLDEAFLDVTGMILLYDDSKKIAELLKMRIKNEIGITASAGIASNKFMAKLASDISKPDGLLFVNFGNEEVFLENLSIEKIWGIGKKSVDILHKAGFKTIGQIAKSKISVLQKYLGNMAFIIKQLALGIDNRPVVVCHKPKSIGTEITFPKDLILWEHLEENLLRMSEKIGRKLRKNNLYGKTITLKIRFSSFKTITRSKSVIELINHDDIIYNITKKILMLVSLDEPIRLLGITISNLQSLKENLSLFQDDIIKKQCLADVIDQIKDRFGENIISRARLLQKKNV